MRESVYHVITIFSKLILYNMFGIVVQIAQESATDSPGDASVTSSESSAESTGTKLVIAFLYFPGRSLAFLQIEL